MSESGSDLQFSGMESLEGGRANKETRSTSYWPLDTFRPNQTPDTYELMVTLDQIHISYKRWTESRAI